MPRWPSPAQHHFSLPASAGAASMPRAEVDYHGSPCALNPQWTEFPPARALQITAKNSHGLSRFVRIADRDQKFSWPIAISGPGAGQYLRPFARTPRVGPSQRARSQGRRRGRGASPRRPTTWRCPPPATTTTIPSTAPEPGGRRLRVPLKPRTRARETRPPCPRGHPPPHRGKPSFFFRRLLPNARLSTCVEAVAIGDESNNYYINTSSCGAPPQPAPVKVPPGGDHPQSACAHRSQPIPDRSAVHAAARSRGASAP